MTLAYRALVAVLGIVTAALVAACSGSPTSSGPGEQVATGQASDPLVVRTVEGAVRGTSRDGVTSWRGIPFAAAPVDELRWRPPQPVVPWDDERPATDFGSACLQGSGSQIAVGTAEDCLFLNVFRPAEDQADRQDALPVMVWIHGGGFQAGSGDLEPDAVRGLVEQGVVVVSLNYRLGRLGFLAHDALAIEAAETGEQAFANFGLLDQVAALQWVQRNVGAFGGDPDLVTVFGISAGGVSVNDLMASPLADGLFDRAVSGSGLGRERPPTYAEAADQGERLMAGLGAPEAGVAELRALPARQVAALDAFVLRNEIPIRDPMLPRAAWQAFRAGEEADVPYLVGSTDLEFVPGQYEALGVDSAALSVRLIGDGQVEALAAYGSRTELARHFLNDVVFTEPARYLATLHARRSPTYRYRFAIASPEVRATYGGVVHGQDFRFVFGQGDAAVPDAAALAEGVATCWVTFARDGVPDCGVDWPTADTQAFVDLTTKGPVVVRDDPWDDRLDLIRELYRP